MQKLVYIGKFNESWNIEGRVYKAEDSTVNAHDEDVAPLLLTGAWAQVDKSLPVPKSDHAKYKAPAAGEIKPGVEAKKNEPV